MCFIWSVLCQRFFYIIDVSDDDVKITFEGLHIHLKVGKNMNVFLKDLVIKVYGRGCAPGLLAKT